MANVEPKAAGGEARRERIERMARLARAYRGWNLRELNEALGRERARIAPESGNPKLDLLARLATALDWDLGEVAERLWDLDDDGGSECAERTRNLGFAELDQCAQGEHRAGAFVAMERTARAMRRIARSPRERAISANRLSGALDGQGRYARALDALRDGLGEPEAGADIRLMLTVNLANANYTLWNLHEARSIAASVLESLAAQPPRTRLERVAEAFGHAVAGHSLRRLSGRCESLSERESLAGQAQRSLEHAVRSYRALADEFDDPQYDGLAHTARGGLVEARVAVGALSADDGIDEILDELDRFVDLEKTASPHLVEGAGWWSVFGANIAMRTGEGPTDRAFAVCINKVAEVGEHLAHWPMRERAFTLEWFRRAGSGRIHGDERRSGRVGRPSLEAWVLDADDLRVLVGAMGRFPFFRPTGWAIIDGAQFAGA